MPEGQYYTISYGLIFVMAGIVVLTGFMSILVEAIIGMGSATKSTGNKYLKNYEEITDIINFEGAKKSELDLAGKSFIHNFLDLPEDRTKLSSDGAQMIKSKLDFVADFVKHPNATEELIEKFKALLIEKCPSYEPDFTKQIEKAFKERK